MATNDFQVFAGGSGANVLTQSAYLAMASLTTGYESGIAVSAQLNKTWRQASVMAAMIGQFICDRTGLNATDDGTTTTLETNFIAAIQSTYRIRAKTTYQVYCSPSGNDANVGTSPATPFATMQGAYNYLCSNVDLNGFSAIINLAGGTYASGLAIVQPLVGQTQGAYVLINGNVSSPGSVVVNCSASVVNTISATNGAYVTVQGITINSSGVGQGGYCLVAQSGGVLAIGPGVVFGSAVTGHIIANLGGLITSSASYTITGSAPFHVCAGQGGNITLDAFTTPAVVTLNNVPTFSTAFAVTTAGTLTMSGYSFSGAASGSRYNCQIGGAISGTAGNVNLFPGTIAGTATTGYYI